MDYPPQIADKLARIEALNAENFWSEPICGGGHFFQRLAEMMRPAQLTGAQIEARRSTLTANGT